MLGVQTGIASGDGRIVGAGEHPVAHAADTAVALVALSLGEQRLLDGVAHDGFHVDAHDLLPAVRGVWPYGRVVADEAEARVEPAEKGLDRPLGDGPAYLPGIQPEPVAGLQGRTDDAKARRCDPTSPPRPASARQSVPCSRRRGVRRLPGGETGFSGSGVPGEAG